MSAGEVECICPYTDPSTWLSAASCGYGSGYEPGSMQEWDPDCPVHPGHPYGHVNVTKGCGGCDPSAIEFVVEDDGLVRRFDPALDLLFPASSPAPARPATTTKEHDHEQ